MKLLKWNKIYKLGEDELHRPPAAALIAATIKEKARPEFLSNTRICYIRHENRVLSIMLHVLGLVKHVTNPIQKALKCEQSGTEAGLRGALKY